MKLSEYAKRNGIHYNTAWRMWRRGELSGRQLPSGTVLLDEPLVSPSPRPMKVVAYARVSNPENWANLEAQAQRVISYSNAKGWPGARVVKACGICARLYGRRRAKRKTAQVLQA